MSDIDSSITPAAAGFRWPAEWEPHSATWLAWPHNRETWPGHFEQIARPFSQFAETLARFEPVHVLVHDRVADQVESMVSGLDNITLHGIHTNDAWIRDYGPTFLVHATEAETAIVDWDFNSWGGKYPPWDLDDRVPHQIAARLGVRSFRPGIVLEGGSIDGNGQGLILTTESCLLDPRRNATLGRADMERCLHDYCCASDVLWLAGGPMAGDDTDGHIDQLARFVSASQVVVAVEDDPADANFEPLQANLARLRAHGDRFDPAWDLIPLPMPRPIVVDGQRLPASYCNFYIANGCVIVPQYDDPADTVVQEIFQSLFPARAVISLPARELVLGLGAFHCLTQQQPQALPPGR